MRSLLSFICFFLDLHVNVVSLKAYLPLFNIYACSFLLLLFSPWYVARGHACTNSKMQGCVAAGFVAMFFLWF